MVGYATDETEERLPLEYGPRPQAAAAAADVRLGKGADLLGPDAKVPGDGAPGPGRRVSLGTVVLSTQHAPGRDDKRSSCPSSRPR